MINRLVCAPLLFMPLIVFATESLPVVEKLRNGFYVSTVDLDGRFVKRYMVDTKARLCYASNELIPCKNLKMRDEWKDIISWVK
jgi:hypothetical protein